MYIGVKIAELHWVPPPPGRLRLRGGGAGARSGAGGHEVAPSNDSRHRQGRACIGIYCDNALTFHF